MSTISQTVTSQQKERSSNIELYRIIVMLLIVAHHYVVNSGVIQLVDNSISTGDNLCNALFYSIFGAWGKTGINSFVLITGYFTCKSTITLRKFLKLFLFPYLFSFVLYPVLIVLPMILYFLYNRQFAARFCLL